MNESTAEKTFYTLNDLSLKFFNVYKYEGFISLSLWLILSIIWSFILISKMYYESKRFKYQSRSRCLMDKKNWNFLKKSHNLKQTTSLLMILLCVLEILVSVSVISLWGHGLSRSKINSRFHIHILEPFNHTFQRSISVEYRLLSGMLISLLISMIDIISMITVCFIECYAFYPSKCRHPVRYGFIRLGAKVSVIMLLSSVVQLLIFQRVVGVFLYVYEYIRLIRLSRKLSLVLHQRYFDARFHENQHARIVMYYKQIHFEFRIGTTVVLTSIFFHLISLVIEGFYPIVLTVLTNPRWFNLVYSIPVPMEYFVPWDNWVLMSVDQIMVMVLGTSVGVAFFIITVPYLFVTCVHVIKLIKKVKKNRDYTRYSFRSDLIEKMIYKHNTDYANQ